MVERRSGRTWTRIRADVWDRSDGTCHYCRKQMHPIRDFTVDHVVPIIRGGDHERSNLVAACYRCNLSKGARVTGPTLRRHAGRPTIPIDRPRVARPPARPAPLPSCESRDASIAYPLHPFEEVAEQLGVPVRDVRSWADRGLVAAYRISGGRVDHREFLRLTERPARDRAGDAEGTGDGRGRVG